MALTIKPRCKYCGYKLVDGVCKFQGCIDYKPDETENANENDSSTMDDNRA